MNEYSNKTLHHQNGDLIVRNVDVRFKMTFMVFLLGKTREVFENTRCRGRLVLLSEYRNLAIVELSD